MAITNNGLIFALYDTTSNTSTLSFGNTTRAISVGELVIIAVASKRTSSGTSALMTSVSIGGTSESFTFVQNTTTGSASVAYAGLTVAYWLADRVIASGTSFSGGMNTTGQGVVAVGFSVSGADLSRTPVSETKIANSSQTPNIAVVPGFENCGGIAFLNYRQDFGTGEVFPTNCINTPLAVSDDFGFINRNTTSVIQLEIMGGLNIGTSTSKTLGASGTTLRTVGVTGITFAPVVVSEPAINLV